MAFWNAPLPAEDHPRRAVEAAFRMIEAVRGLNDELRAEEGKGAPAGSRSGVGINTGDCVVGNVGSRWRYDYSVLGDTVNLASRLEGLTKEYGVSIILGPATAEAVGGIMCSWSSTASPCGAAPANRRSTQSCPGPGATIRPWRSWSSCIEP